jgi:glycine dehydrogenase subunit 1
MPFIPHTDEDTRAMLDRIGAPDPDALFADIPPEFAPKSFALPKGMSEMEVCARIEKLAAQNRAPAMSFVGAGYYDHYIPKAVDALAGRGEFVTAYTPYQAESSQGTLQAVFEYQTAMTRLFGMDCANASVYDGGSALFEAAMMAVRHTGRRRLIIDETLNPVWRRMLASCLANRDTELVTVPHRDGLSDKAALAAAVDERCAALLTQNPNFFGVVEDFGDIFAQAAACGALSVLSVYPVMQAVLKTPGEMGADIAVAEGQSLGLPLSFGGPYLGVMTCRKALVRQLPGRIAGRAHDRGGKNGYVLTLQAREQHIRRAKATSNICSNQALCALRALAHLCLLGPRGLAHSAESGMEKARYAALRLCALPGVRLLNAAPFGNEFAVRLPVDAAPAVEKCAAEGCVPGFPAGRHYPALRDVLLVACTEKSAVSDIDAMAEKVGGAL